MKTRLNPIFKRCATGLALCGQLSTVQAAPTFMVTDMGSLPGLAMSTAQGISSDGRVVGQAGTGLAATAFAATVGQMVNLNNTQGANVSIALGINSSGQAVGGLSLAANAGTVPALFSAGAAPQVLNVASEGGTARAINNAGDYVGEYVPTGGTDTVAFIKSSAGLQLLPGLGASRLSANDINDAGQVVGTLTFGNGVRNAYLYSAGSTLTLGTLGGANSQALGISSNGQVVGQSLTAARQTHAFLWRNGVMTDLAALPGDERSFGWAVNASGWVVGQSTDLDLGASRYFLFRDGVMDDLASLLDLAPGWALAGLTDINDQGQMAATLREVATGTTRAVRLDPIAAAAVPVPGTAPLVLVALLALARKAAQQQRRRGLAGPLHPSEAADTLA